MIIEAMVSNSWIGMQQSRIPINPYLNPNIIQNTFSSCAAVLPPVPVGPVVAAPEIATYGAEIEPKSAK